MKSAFPFDTINCGGTYVLDTDLLGQSRSTSTTLQRFCVDNRMLRLCGLDIEPVHTFANGLFSCTLYRQLLALLRKTIHCTGKRAKLTSSFRFLASASPAILSFALLLPPFFLRALLPVPVFVLERPAVWRAVLSCESCEPPIVVVIQLIQLIQLTGMCRCVNEQFEHSDLASKKSGGFLRSGNCTSSAARRA